MVIKLVVLLGDFPYGILCTLISVKVVYRVTLPTTDAHAPESKIEPACSQTGELVLNV